MRQKKSRGRIVGETTFNRGKERKSSNLKVPRHCPLVPSVKVG
jgi:hypothetical protein